MGGRGTIAIIPIWLRKLECRTESAAEGRHAHKMIGGASVPLRQSKKAYYFMVLAGPECPTILRGR